MSYCPWDSSQMRLNARARTHSHTLGQANKQGYRIYQAFHVWKEGLYCKNADLLEFHIRQHFEKKRQTNICGHLDIGEFLTVPSLVILLSSSSPLISMLLYLQTVI